MASSVSVTVKDSGAVLRFSGVTAVRISQSLRVASGSEGEDAADLMNGARNQPTKVTLSVVETDTAGNHRCRNMLAALTALRAGRKLCRVRTAIMDFDSLLLTDFTAVRDEAGPESWTGTLTFTEVLPESGSGASGPEGNTGIRTGGARVSGEEAETIFAQAGIILREEERT